MKTQGIAPVFLVADLSAALKFYVEMLNFSENFRFDNYAGVRHGEAAIQLCGHNEQKRPRGGGAAYIFCDGLDDTTP